MKAEFVLAIDRIVLDGITLAPRELAQLRVALERELTQLFERDASDASAWSGRALATLRAASSVPHDAVSGSEFGRSLARSIYASVAPATPQVRPFGGQGGERP
jgi:hypothetical protein